MSATESFKKRGCSGWVMVLCVRSHTIYFANVLYRMTHNFSPKIRRYKPACRLFRYTVRFVTRKSCVEGYIPNDILLNWLISRINVFRVDWKITHLACSIALKPANILYARILTPDVAYPGLDMQWARLSSYWGHVSSHCICYATITASNVERLSRHM